MKEIILKYINKIYPNLKSPRYSKSGRKDIIVKFNRNFVNRRNVQQILIYYNFNNINYDNDLNHELINISYPESFSYVDDDAITVEEYSVPLNYNPIFLLDIVNKLSRENNIVGRTIPFKINDVFKKYNFKLLTKKEYMSFFDEIRILI